MKVSCHREAEPLLQDNSWGEDSKVLAAEAGEGRSLGRQGEGGQGGQVAGNVVDRLADGQQRGDRDPGPEEV